MACDMDTSSAPGRSVMVELTLMHPSGVQDILRVSGGTSLLRMVSLSATMSSFRTLGVGTGPTKEATLRKRSTAPHARTRAVVGNAEDGTDGACSLNVHCVE